MKTPLRCLIIEDSEDDFRLILRELTASGYEVASERVQTAAAMRVALDRSQWDIVISDYRMPGFDGLAALEVLRASGRELPLIIVSGTIGEDLAVAAMRAGAQDYLIKGKLARLVPAVQRELRDAVSNRARLAAEKALAEARSIQDAIFNHTTDFVWTVEPRNFGLMTLNPAFKSYFLEQRGMQVQVGQRPEDLFPTADFVDLWRGYYQRTLQSGPFSTEYATFSGKTTLLLSFNVLKRDGVVFGISVFGRDITERMRIEEALHRSERHFRALSEHALDIVTVLGVDGIILYESPSMERVLGWKPEELVGRNAFELIHPDDVGSVRELFERKLPLPGVIDSAEFRYRHKDGSWRELEAIATNLIDDPVVAGIVVNARDVSDRRAADRRVYELTEIIAAANEGMMIVNGANEITMWNHGAESIIGRTAAEAVGRRPEEVLGVEDHELVSTLRHAVERDGHWRGELRAKVRDGREILLDCRITLVRDEAGQPRARINFFTDVTEAKLLEEKFLHVQRLESVGMLAAGIAHDLNNVLAPIMIAAPMLRDSLSAERDLRILGTLEKSAERGAGLVKQILGFARSSAGEFTAIQVKHLLRDVVGLIEETFPKSIRLEREIAGDLWHVHGNPTQIHQVIINLCVNARDAMPQGGVLGLRAANREIDAAAAMTLPGARPGHWLVLEVSDTGTGIAPELRDRIWEPFFTTKGLAKGTGLGLSTVRGIVAGHLGFVEVQTEVGRGTTFRVYLPAVEVAPAKRPSAEPFEAPRGSGELVMLVDDDARVRDMAAAILESHGYRVARCGDGIEGMATFAARASEVGVVVTDIDMPRLGGLALARYVLQQRPDIRVIAISGLSRIESEDPGVKDSAKLVHAYLRKPFKAGDLLRAVHEQLPLADTP